MRNYRCPACGKVPTVTTTGANNYIGCCNISVNDSYFFISVLRWKKLVKLFIKKETK